MTITRGYHFFQLFSNSFSLVHSSRDIWKDPGNRSHKDTKYNLKINLLRVVQVYKDKQENYLKSKAN